MIAKAKPVRRATSSNPWNVWTSDAVGQSLPGLHRVLSFESASCSGHCGHRGSRPPRGAGPMEPRRAGAIEGRRRRHVQVSSETIRHLRVPAATARASTAAVLARMPAWRLPVAMPCGNGSNQLRVSEGWGGGGGWGWGWEVGGGGDTRGAADAL